MADLTGPRPFRGKSSARQTSTGCWLASSDLAQQTSRARTFMAQTSAFWKLNDTTPTAPRGPSSNPSLFRLILARDDLRDGLVRWGQVTSNPPKRTLVERTRGASPAQQTLVGQTWVGGLKDRPGS